jgi:hypothetical protein
MEENLHVGVRGDIAAVFRGALLGQSVLAQDKPPKTVGDLVATLADVNAQNLSHSLSSGMVS